MLRFKRIATVVALLAVQWTDPAQAQPIREPAESIIIEHTRRYTQGDNITVVMWVSQLVWSHSTQDIPEIGERRRAALLKMTEPYLIFLIADGKYRPYEGTHYYPESLVRGTFRVKDSEGRLYAPLPEGSVSHEVRVLTDSFRPTVVRTYGTFGKGLKLLFFDNRDADGKPLANPYEGGSLTVVATDREFVFQLPLPSALPPKVDARTGQKFPGTYKFNPYTGEALAP